MHVASSHGLQHTFFLVGAITTAIACTFFIPAAGSQHRYIDDGCGTTNDE
jgi:hypothetical protein